MKKRNVLFFVALISAAAAVFAASAHAAPWRLVESAQDTGEYSSAMASDFVQSAAAFKATVSAPRGAEVTYSVDCDRGGRSISREKELVVRRTRSWVFKPTMKHASCYVSVYASADWDAGAQTVKVRLFQRGGSTGFGF
jgi:hypothetical protein